MSARVRQASKVEVLFVVTFYSFKGGVGRSMALANVADLLAQAGAKVLTIDWDLEAPGLERYLMNSELAAQKTWAWPGVIDLVEAYKAYVAGAGEEPPHVEDFVHRVERLGMDPGAVYMTTAGRRGRLHREAYAAKVQTFDWNEFYERWAGGDLLDTMLAELESLAFDYVLIDSRTGVSEQGGICTHHLADAVVLVSGPNDVSVEATAWMHEMLTQPSVRKSRGGRELYVLPVASRVEENAEKSMYLEFLARFERTFGDRLPDFMRGTSHLRDTQIPYIPFYALRERVAAREPPGEAHPTMLRAYQALARSIALTREHAHPDAHPPNQAEPGVLPSQQDLNTLATIEKHALAWSLVADRGYFSPSRALRWRQLLPLIQVPSVRRFVNIAWSFAVMYPIVLAVGGLATLAAWQTYNEAQETLKATQESAYQAIDAQKKLVEEERKLAKDQRDRLQASMLEKQEEVTSAKHYLSDANERLSKLESQLKGVQELSETEKKSLISNLETARAIRTQRERALDSARDALELSQTAHRESQTRLRQSEEIKERLDRQLHDAKARMAELTLLLDRRSRENQELTQRIQRLESQQINQLKQTSDAAKADINSEQQRGQNAELLE